MKRKGFFDRLGKRVFGSLAGESPIPFDVVQDAEVLFPNLYARQVRLESTGWKWGDLDREKGLLFLCSLVAGGHTPVVEFGTFRGRTTYHLALNCNDQIHTVDLGSPASARFTSTGAEPTTGVAVSAGLSLRQTIVDRLSFILDRFGLGNYITGEVFRDAPDEISSRIHQHLGDSRTVDLSDLYGQAGLVIVDGGHSYDVCLSDSENAFKLIRPGGIILWDDYNQYWPGVKVYIDALSKERKLYFLPEEQFVVFIDTPETDGSRPDEVAVRPDGS